MVKERQDITGSKCLKGVTGKVIVDDKGIKDSWREYMEKLMNEENEWDHRISAGVKEGPTGLPFLFVLSTIPNMSVFNFLLFSILHMWPNSQTFLWMALCIRSFSSWVFHIFHDLFLAASNWYIGSFGNSTSQMPAVCLWSFYCMSRFHTHIALCMFSLLDISWITVVFFFTANVLARIWPTLHTARNTVLWQYPSSVFPGDLIG